MGGDISPKAEASDSEYTTTKHLLSSGANYTTEGGLQAYSNIEDSTVTVASIKAKGGKYAKCTAETKKKDEIDKEYYYRLSYENTVGSFMTDGFTDSKGQHHGATHLVKKFYKQYQVYSQVYSYTETDDTAKTVDYYYFIYIWRELTDDDYHETSAKDVLTYCIQYGESLSNSDPTYTKEKSSYDALGDEEKYKIACAIYYGPHRDKDGTYYKSLDHAMADGIVGYDPSTWTKVFWKKYIATQLYIWSVTNSDVFSYSDALKTAKQLDNTYTTTDADICESFLKEINTYVKNAVKVPSFMSRSKDQAAGKKLLLQNDGTYKLVLTDNNAMLNTGTFVCDNSSVKISVDSDSQLTIVSSTELTDVMFTFQKNTQVPDGTGLLYYANSKTQNMVNSVVSTEGCYAYMTLTTSGVDEVELAVQKQSDLSVQGETASLSGACYAVFTSSKTAAVYDPTTKTTMVDGDGNKLKAQDYVAGYIYRPEEGVWQMLPYTDSNLAWITSQGYSWHTLYNIAYYVKQGNTSTQLPNSYCIVTDEAGYAYTKKLKMCKQDGTDTTWYSYYLLEYQAPSDCELTYPVDISDGKVNSGRISVKWNTGESGYENPIKVHRNIRKKGELCIYKYEEESLIPLSGVSFEIYSDASCTSLVTVAVTDDTGRAYIKDLTWGTYYVKEQQGQSVHVPDNGIVQVVVNPGEISYVDKSNTPVTVCIHLQKEADVSNLPDGLDVSGYDMEGAEYALYARESVIGANGKILYEPDAYICTLTCDKEGDASVDLEFAKENLRIGKYYLKEIKAPYGFLLDETVYEIDATNLQDMANSETPDTDEYEQTQALYNVWVDIHKEQFELNAIHIYKYAEETKISSEHTLSDAVFSVYNVSLMEQDGIFASEEDIISVDFTKEQYDKYRMPIQSDSQQPYIMTTDSEGTAQTTLLPDGEYVLVEVEAPAGYKKTEAKMVSLPEDANEGIVYMRLKDEAKKGSIKLLKLAEAPVGVSYTNTEYGTVAGIEYTSCPLSGIQFQIYDSAMREIEMIMTDEDGTAECTNLPLGVYYVKELCTLAGMVLDTQLYQVEIKEDETEQIVNAALKINNALMTTDMLIYKNGETIIPSDTTGFSIENAPLEGAVFGIYNASTITAYDGSSLLAPDQLMGLAVSNQDGIAEFQGKLLPGQYYCKELCAPEGYKIDAFQYPVALTLLSNEPVERTEVNKDAPACNQLYSASVKIKKVDGTNHSICLSDVEFDLYDAVTDEVVGTYITDENGEINIEGMPYGSWYFKEKKTAEGYAVDTTIHSFQITEAEEDVHLLVENEPKIDLGYEQVTYDGMFHYLILVAALVLCIVLEEAIRRKWKK